MNTQTMDSGYDGDIWIAVLDRREARLLRGHAIGAGPDRRLRLELVQSLENTFRELDREGQLETLDHDPRNVGSRSAELHARYAVDGVKWLADHVQRRGIEQLDVFARPRLLTLLRAMYSVALRGRVIDHSFGRDRVSLRELERDSEVLGAVENRLGRRFKKIS